MNALIGFCLDESSSMNAGATKTAFNIFLRLQQCRIDDCSLFLSKFGDYYEPTVEFQSIFTVPLMSTPDYGKGTVGGNTDGKRRSGNWAYDTALHYYPSGGTLLFDSMGFTISAMEKHIALLPDDEKPQRVTLVVQTDGGNTDSQTTPDQLATEIARLIAKGWDVIFLADISSGDMASRMALATGFPKGATLEYKDPSKGFEEASERILESVVTGKLGAAR